MASSKDRRRPKSSGDALLQTRKIDDAAFGAALFGFFECPCIGCEIVGEVLGEHGHDVFAFGRHRIVEGARDGGFDDGVFGDVAVLGAVVCLLDVVPIWTDVNGAVVLGSDNVGREAGEIRDLGKRQVDFAARA